MTPSWAKSVTRRNLPYARSVTPVPTFPTPPTARSRRARACSVTESSSGSATAAPSRIARENASRLDRVLVARRDLQRLRGHAGRIRPVADEEPARAAERRVERDLDFDAAARPERRARAGRAPVHAARADRVRRAGRPSAGNSRSSEASRSTCVCGSRSMHADHARRLPPQDPARRLHQVAAEIEQPSAAPFGAPSARSWGRSRES